VIVVDASVIANALGDDGAAGAVARKRLDSAGDLLAPNAVDVETLSGLRKRWLAGKLSDVSFREAVDALQELPIARHPALPLLQRAYYLRGNVTAYDAVYVALAEAFDCPLVTADARLAKAPGPTCQIELLTP
jgi:predicted nucleic acid-binding protein